MLMETIIKDNGRIRKLMEMVYILIIMDKNM